MNKNQPMTKPWFSSEYSHLFDITSDYSIMGNDNSSETVRGDEWDRIGLQEILNNNHRSLFNKKSTFQNIQIIEATDIRMYLDEQLQFSSIDERIYHEALVHPAFTISSNHERVLILGGGDGLALREVLKYDDVKHVDLVDLDPLVLDAAKNVKKLADINEYSLYDSRVTVHPQDAVNFLSTNRTPYHIILVDFPDPTDQTISDLYTTEFFSLLKRSLKDDGVVVCQSNSPEDTPIVFWSIGKTLESSGFKTLSYHTIIPSFGDWGFHIGSNRSLSIGNKRVQVPSSTLPANLKNLFHFPREILAKKNSAILNSKKNSKLHEIFKKESLYDE